MGFLSVGGTTIFSSKLTATGCPVVWPMGSLDCMTGAGIVPLVGLS